MDYLIGRFYLSYPYLLPKNRAHFQTRGLPIGITATLPTRDQGWYHAEVDF